MCLSAAMINFSCRLPSLCMKIIRCSCVVFDRCHISMNNTSKKSHASLDYASLSNNPSHVHQSMLISITDQFMIRKHFMHNGLQFPQLSSKNTFLRINLQKFAKKLRSFHVIQIANCKCSTLPHNLFHRNQKNKQLENGSSSIFFLSINHPENEIKLLSASIVPRA